MSVRLICAGIILALGVGAAAAQQKFSRQQQEAACSDDAFALCGDVIPDEQRVAACMVAKRAKLSQRCRLVFDVSVPDEDDDAPAKRRKR